MFPASSSLCGLQNHRMSATQTTRICIKSSMTMHGINHHRLPTAGDVTTSGRQIAAERLVAFAGGEGLDDGASQFSQFRGFQQQAAAAARQQLADGPGERGQPGGGYRSQPYRKSYWGQLPQGWFAKPEYTAASLYEEIVRKCETNTCGQDALFMICRLATNTQEARIVLNAFAAVRASLVRQGSFKPYSEPLAAAFVHMIRSADAPDVLVEALQRASELGLLLSRTRLHEILRHWGEMGDLAKIEEVLGSMPLGGVAYDHVTAYIVIRTAVNLGAQDKAEYYAAAMQQRQIRLTNATVKLLELGRQRQRDLQRAAAAGTGTGRRQ
ncbi:hypothetical protein Vretifemale_19885 [Volvox reticuliferus]|uniref:Pentacotripeptide-repeat region of PRORP domain-containing protein n=1 Tax=Volvox reticuliferus TaxID=1737510 RepID=A0A8J4D4C1_9CHLO|nr:hypothetical protein Vretifemale_19885 [Volvox reticuliferus]